MATADKITVQLEPTVFASWLVKHWYVGVLVAPFFRFLPIRWIAKAVVPKEQFNQEHG